ncbi:tRNA(Ile)-lysidine synthase [Quillaja saponaria]|uniref:tRNA(Ile)-lysidine synthetase n=1 Tax=Quillaja saponaria TaxID=32244 RepID=A0AAD7M433_QUISA|nr:tRNA(Ile)-lysidine synthase [Quillaja saponaria]
MAGGLILSSQARTSTATLLAASISKIQSRKCRIPFVFHHYHLPQPCSVPLTRYFCVLSSTQDAIDMSMYKEAFSRRMTMVGLKPYHRIALGVSGGPDSMALCVLTAWWKTSGLDATSSESDGFIDGLLAVVVDHGLRAESKEEANIVSHRVSGMGIRCEIAHCDWLDGKPKQGHLQEAAREMRYQIFHKACIQHQIGVLLIAHHADDQAELFILRLSRNSGVLGLAGMPSTSQFFSKYTHSYEVPVNHGILLVRPLLDFSKEEMYKICQGGGQDWVEDPTNQSPLFARNRIRMSLNVCSSYSFKSELQAVISACRKTRSYADQVCHRLINHAVVIRDHGYAVIDLEILNLSKVEDICLSKFVSLVLQFISQRHRPIRGSTSRLLLDYMHTFPCKTSLTAAGCYLCPAPGSRGSRALVCCSVDGPLPSKMELFHACSDGEQENFVVNELEKIIADGKSYADCLVPDVSYVHFLDVTPELVLTEAKRLNLLSEPTCRNILLLQKEETKRFRSKTEVTSDSESKSDVQSVGAFHSKPLQHGQRCYFMNRFVVTWKLCNEVSGNAFSEVCNCSRSLVGEGRHVHCRARLVGHNSVIEVRHMIESDWLYLAKLSKYSHSEMFKQQEVIPANRNEQIMESTTLCLDYARMSAQSALFSLKSIPVAARRSLPVLVNQQGQLLSIPSISFRHCPCLMVYAEFKPRVPLGGGYSSFI